MVDRMHHGTSTRHLTSLFYQETGKGSKVHTRRTRVFESFDRYDGLPTEAVAENR